MTSIRPTALTRGNPLPRIAGALLICAMAPAAWAKDLPRIDPLDQCFVQPATPIPGVSFDCGHVVVPEDPAKPGGRTLRLGFLRASGGTDRTSLPLVMIAGGPGDTLIQPEMFYLFSDDFLGPLLAGRDIIVLEQRGARYSEPFLDCPEIEALALTAVEQNLAPTAATELRNQAMGVCARRAEANEIDLAQYNVRSIVADIEAARVAFGQDRIAFYGASYGAQIGQHLLRDHPETLVAVVLDGANALSATSWVQDRARDADEALDRLDALCKADAKCAAAYDLRALVDQGMALFAAGPLQASIADPADPARKLAFQITGEDFAGLVFGLQTGQSAIRSMPAFLAELLAGGEESVVAILGEMAGSALLAARTAAPQQTAALAHAAVVCSDDPVSDATDLVIPDKASPYARAMAASVFAQYRSYCAAVAVPELPATMDEDATSDVPTLVLAGALDARTPLFRSAEVADHLRRATLAIFPEGTHVQLGEVNACAAAILRGFLEHPGTPPDQSCIAAMPKRGFVLPDGTNSVDAGP